MQASVEFESDYEVHCLAVGLFIVGFSSLLAYFRYGSVQAVGATIASSALSAVACYLVPWPFELGNGLRSPWSAWIFMDVLA